MNRIFVELNKFLKAETLIVVQQKKKTGFSNDI